MKHTPGPWIETSTTGSLDENAIWACIGPDDRYKTVAEVKGHHYGVPFEEFVANVKLISAAPDMLEALKEARSLLQGDGIYGKIPSGALNKITAAIKKATE